ncbi:MFS general substrate transporter [Abortiporus biennis]|nr:MFS general substrate transporter [Abortiporus biennis]
MQTTTDVEKTDAGSNHSGTAASRNATPVEKFEVTELEPSEDPQILPKWRKWLTVLILNAGVICVTGSSSMASFAEVPTSLEFHVSTEVTTLSISLFVMGLGVGPLICGPFAEVIGQRIIYLISFFILWVLTWPVAFSHSIAVHMIFRFLGGLGGSAFLSIAAGTITDMFSDDDVGTPMAAYTISTFIGPNLSPVFSGFIVQYAGWRWLYYTLIIWEFVQLLALFMVPETSVPILLKWKAQKLRRTTGDTRYYAPIEKEKTSLFQKIRIGIWHILELIFHDQMALSLDIWLALILGIIYLAFQSFPIIFVNGHGFSNGQLGLTFIGVNIGLAIAMYNHNPPPEVWLGMGKIGAVLVPIGLYIMAFTTFKHVHWIAPIIGTIPFGIGVCFCYTSTFTYLVTAYRPMAAAAMSGNAVIRTCFAGGFPMFANPMYNRLGTVGATALLAGLTTVMAPLPFIFAATGEKLRARSRFATKPTTPAAIITSPEA